MKRNLAKSSVSALLVGGTAGLGQVALLRELMVLAGGSELSLGLGLAAWLLLGALGAWGASGWVRRAPAAWPLVPLIMVGAGGLASLALARVAPLITGLPLGAVLPLGSMALAGLLVLAPLALADGAAFPLLLATARPEPTPLTAGRLYGLETLGHGLGALVLVGLQAAGLNPVSLLASGALAAALWGAVIVRGRGRALALAWSVACLAALILSSPLDVVLRDWQWRGRVLAAHRETPYAQLVATRAGGQTDFFASGQWLFSLPRPRQAERDALLPLLARPEAKSALFIGGAASGSAALAARRGDLKRVDAVELDSWLVEMAHGSGPAQEPPNLSFIIADGRAYLEQLDLAGRGYDLVVVLLPLGSTIQANRFYTREGLAALAKGLTPDGVAVLTLPGVEGMIGRLQARRLGSLLAAARQVFTQVVLMSGPELRLFLSGPAGPLTPDPAVWQDRLARRDWEGLAGLGPQMLAQELMPFNLARLEAAIAQAGPHQANRDFTPRALLWDASLWGWGLGGMSGAALALGNLRPGHLLWPLAVLAAAAWLWGGRRGRRRSALGPGVFTAGLSAMSLSLLLIMVHQALFGAAYLGLAWLLAAFMLGLALAALWVARSPGPGSPSRPAWLLSALAGACLLTWGAAHLLQHAAASPAWALVLAGIAALDGGLTGAFFSAAAQQREAAAMVHPGSRSRGVAGRGGRLYALDLAGGVIGALLPICLLPTVGLGPALAALALINLAAAGAGRGG